MKPPIKAATIFYIVIALVAGVILWQFQSVEPVQAFCWSIGFFLAMGIAEFFIARHLFLRQFDKIWPEDDDYAKYLSQEEIKKSYSKKDLELLIADEYGSKMPREGPNCEFYDENIDGYLDDCSGGRCPAPESSCGDMEQDDYSTSKEGS